MALLYADENIEYAVVEYLRLMGHDVLTAQEDGHRSRPDPIVLARAHALGRVVLTHNRRHSERLDQQGAAHSGMIGCTRDDDFAALASRIDAVLIGVSPGRWCRRVNKPSPPKKGAP